MAERVNGTFDSSEDFLQLLLASVPEHLLPGVCEVVWT